MSKEIAELKKQLEELKAKDDSVCPHCGHCKHCGRGGQQTYPVYPIYPYYPQPYAPWWQVWCGSGTYQAPAISYSDNISWTVTGGTEQ